MARPNKSGVYNAITQKFPLSAQAQAQSEAQDAQAITPPPGALVITEEQLAKLIAKASERAVNAALDKLTQPQPVFPEPASGDGGGT